VALEPTNLRVDEDGAILCLVCGYTYVHPVAVRVNRGGEITVVDHRGTHMEAGQPSERGVLISVTYQCENGGHRFQWDGQFHKGNTFATCRYQGDGVPDDLNTIWRD
jgi:hypothetical protein